MLSETATAIRLRRLRANNPGYTARKNAEWRKRNRPAYLAQKAVEYALKVGRLVRQPCEVCADERSEAHHPDYAKRLEVKWLCKAHHEQAHHNEKGSP